jgi:hypothetical protein
MDTFLKVFMPVLMMWFADDGGTGEGGGGGDDGQSGNEGGSPIPDWRSVLPEDMRSHPSISKYKTLDAFAASYLEKDKLIGRKHIPVAPEILDEMTPEDWNRVYTQLGRPETPDGYDLSEIEVSEDLKLGDEFITSLKAKAHEVGVLPSQLKELYSWFTGNLKVTKEQIDTTKEQSRADAEKQLQKEWGYAYKQRLEVAQNALQHFADKEMMQFLEESGFGNNPNVVRFMSRIASEFGEDKFKGSSKTTAMTPAEAQIEIQRIENDDKSPYYDSSHPEHGALVDRMQTLYAIAYPE